MNPGIPRLLPAPPPQLPTLRTTPSPPPPPPPPRRRRSVRGSLSPTPRHHHGHHLTTALTTSTTTHPPQATVIRLQRLYLGKYFSLGPQTLIEFSQFVERLWRSSCMHASGFSLF
ncbi:hypothetical protein Vretifemale_13878 [Volvox reticuliferus]|uniref:Uncharacterized protein n=1 Tax=Volvox reticuliferus TaxID=1737510 RepID=A0A8J4FSJ2_9CHLO|nr:hypothetical protein Vretifemale_13878 [Volvox reticuliferus]